MSGLQVLFVTGNQEKVREAAYACRDYDIDIIQKEVSVSEIQHHDPDEITRHKAFAAYEILGEPVVVNDSSWSIPALGGFPGGYMKDISGWLSTDDFARLMAGNKDKSIILTEVTAYFDGSEYRAFRYVRRGKFIDTPRGRSSPSFARLVVMEDDEVTISEMFDRGERTVDPRRYGHWRAFAEWYCSRRGDTHRV